MNRLKSLRVENLALITAAEIELSEGLNVLTGETGAGKTMLAKALEALLGAKTTKGVVRPGAEAAYIEAVFSAPPALAFSEQARELLADSEGEIVLARRIAAEGRSRCLVNGRTTSLEVLKELATSLIAFYGQHEGRRLMMDNAQVEILDRSGDGKGLALRGKYAKLRSEAREAQARLEVLVEAQANQGREVELARFELQELDDLSPKAGEEAELMAELSDLSGALGGQQACAAAYNFLDGEGGAGQQLLAAARELSSAGNKVAELHVRLEASYTEIADIASEIDVLGSSWEADPVRQTEVEARLSSYNRLAKKHMVESDELVAVYQRLSEAVVASDQNPQLIMEAQKEVEEALRSAIAAAGELTSWRSKQAPRLAKAITSSLQNLAMEGARFDIQLAANELNTVASLGEAGAESVTFMLQANPGLPAEPVSEVASGGEVSRLMLALVSEVGLAKQAVMVLDEPDTGIGGQTAHGVAASLKALADRTQLLVISHLPQIAAQADRHFRLVKDTDGSSTQTHIDTLSDEEEVVDELCRMSGHQPDSPEARRAARRLLPS